MKNVTLRQLRYFEALAHHGHFGRAAEASSISQPALSIQIKDLEDSLGLALFERGARHVRLTGFGKELLTRAHDILRSVDELGEMARAAQSAMMTRLRLGVIPTIAPYLLPKIMGELRQDFPGLDLQIRETLTSRLVDELQDGRLDAAILALPLSVPGLTEMPLFDEDFVLVRPRCEAALPPPDPSNLARERLLLLEEGHCFRDQALSFCEMKSAIPRESLDGSSLTTLVQMVGAEMGITLIPEMAEAVETASADVVVSRFDAPQPSRTIGMVWRKTSPLAAQFNAIGNVVRSAAGHKEN